MVAVGGSGGGRDEWMVNDRESLLMVRLDAPGTADTGTSVLRGPVGPSPGLQRLHQVQGFRLGTISARSQLAS